VTVALWVVVAVVLLLVIAAMLMAFGRVERRLDELEQGLRADLGALIREQREANAGSVRSVVREPPLAPPTPRDTDPR
jgi:hypothetical protein